MSVSRRTMLPDQFSAEIERERTRTDRTGRQFSLVIFKLTGRESSDRVLFEGLRRRVRSTDLIGRLNTGELAALLPETSEEGAAAFARQVCEIAPDHSGNYSISTYPSGRPRSGRSDSRSGDAQAEGRRGPGEDLFLAPRSRWKRLLDPIGATAMLVITSPLLLATALAIKLGSPGPVIFKQRRLGLAGRPFTMWKFRTMQVDTSPRPHSDYVHTLIGSAEPMAKIDEELPLIPLGRLLRRSCIDELPQLVNVLRGEMSLVGPRPCLPYEEEDYLQWHRVRFQALPGMTGLWQVSGKNRTTFEQMIRLDIRYSRRPSFWQDTWILIKTLPVMLFESCNPSLSGAAEDRSLSRVTEDEEQC